MRNLQRYCAEWVAVGVRARGGHSVEPQTMATLGILDLERHFFSYNGFAWYGSSSFFLDEFCGLLTCSGPPILSSLTRGSLDNGHRHVQTCRQEVTIQMVRPEAVAYGLGLGIDL